MYNGSLLCNFFNIEIREKEQKSEWNKKSLQVNTGSDKSFQTLPRSRLSSTTLSSEQVKISRISVGFSLRRNYSCKMSIIHVLFAAKYQTAQGKLILDSGGILVL